MYIQTCESVKHKLDLFDKLISPILNYASHVWDFILGHAIKRVQMQRLVKHFYIFKKQEIMNLFIGHLVE